MMKRLFIVPLLAVLFFVACAPTTESEQPVSKQASGPTVTVYRAPT